MTRARPAVLRTAALAAAALLSLTACTSTADPVPPPTTPASPVVVPLRVDPALDPRTGGAAHTRDWNLAATSGDVDPLAAAVVTTPGEPARVGLWRWAVSDDMPPVEVDLHVPGSVRDVALASVGGRVTVAGTTVQGRESAAYVRVSQDTTTWTALAVDPPTARLTEATCSGTVAHVAGTTAGDAVVWASVTDQDVVLTDVVPAADGVRRQVIDMAATPAPEGDDLVAVLYRETGTDGVQRPVVVARAADGTWGEPVVVDAHPGVEVNGIRARPTGGWTATGGAPSGAGTAGALRPTAWRTLDGTTWTTIDDPYLGESEWLAGDLASWVLGKPAESGQAVPMWRVGGRRVVAVLGLDDVESAWFGQFESDPAPVDGVTGVLEYPEGGAPFILVNGSGWASIGGWAPPGYTEFPGTWWPVADVSPVAPATAVVGDVARDGRGSGQVGTRTLREVDGGWVTTWRSAALRVDGHAVVPAGPPLADGSQDAWTQEVSRSGERLVVRQRTDAEFSSRLETTLVGADGVPGALGVLGGGGARAQDVVHDGTRWLVAGADATTSLTTEVERPSVWTSPDGVAWTHLELDVGGARQGAAEAVCRAGSLVVGWTSGHDGSTHAAMWRIDGDTTEPVDHAIGSTTPAWFGGCRTADGTTFVHGWVSGVAVLWRITDDDVLEQVLTAPVGATFDPPVPAAGGWAAWGTVDDDDGTGPVVWWSPDGREWTTVALPADVPVDDGIVLVDGTDVVAVGWGAAGMQAWRVVGLVSVPVAAATTDR